MTTRRWPLLFVVLILAYAAYWLREREKIVTEKMLQTSATPQQDLSKPIPLSGGKNSQQTTSDILQNNKTSVNTIHLQQMIQFLKTSAFQPDLKTTLDRLQNMKTKPTYFQDSNPFTGTMYVVRTEKPLAGTRYFHAQFFSDEKNKPLLQHMSFEIPKGKDSLRQAAAALKQSFPELTQPEMQKDGFILWKWKGGYNLWAMQLKKEQLQGDPFNAYTEKDEGTVRVAMELDIPHSHQ